MELSILILDDEISSLNSILSEALDTNIYLNPGSKNSYDLPKNFILTKNLKINFFFNTEFTQEKLIEEIGSAKSNPYDIVLIDDDWGTSGSSMGQEILLPYIIRNIKNMNKQLPVVALFTQHYDQDQRMTALFRQMQNEFAEQAESLMAISKEDRVGLKEILTKAVCKKLKFANISGNSQTSDQNDATKDIIGNSEKIKEIKNIIIKHSSIRLPVLITGESGTGKELVARAVHNARRGRDAPFESINCGAIAPGLFESEMFGHERGAFTGAHEKRDGVFVRANEGTVFLDEIAEMPLDQQAKLLRVLDDHEVSIVGGRDKIKLDIQIISATNKNLKKRIKEKKFRQDLYNRISALTIHVPPLKERKYDIPILIQHFISKEKERLRINKEFNITKSALSMLQGYNWEDSNIRVLENKIIKAVNLCNANETYALTSDLFLEPNNGSTEPTMKLVEEEKEELEGFDREKLAKARIYLDEIEKLAKSSNRQLTQKELAAHICKRNTATGAAVSSRLSKVKFEIIALLRNHPDEWPMARETLHKWPSISKLLINHQS